MLEAHGVGFRYNATRWVIRDVSLAVPDGAMLAILGSNARGKTTLAKILAGLLRPTAGHVQVNRQAAYVPQLHGGAFAYSVTDMILMGRTRFLRPFAMPGPDDHRAVASVMDRVGITHLATRSFRDLSGGERQLVYISRALVGECRVLILDEPLSALDLRNQARVLELLRRLADEGMTVVMTTHHPDHALHVAEYSMLIVDSTDVRFGPTPALLTAETLTTLYQQPICTVDADIHGVRRRIAVPDLGPGLSHRTFVEVPSIPTVAE